MAELKKYVIISSEYILYVSPTKSELAVAGDETKKLFAAMCEEIESQIKKDGKTKSV